jgi:WD40 repeat protein
VGVWQPCIRGLERGAWAQVARARHPLSSPNPLMLQPTPSAYTVRSHPARWFTDATITTAGASDAKKVLAFGTEDGTLLLSVTDSQEASFHTAVTDAPINEISWLSSDILGLAADDEKVYLYNVSKDLVSELVGHDAGINCVRRYDENVFFTGSKDGRALGWDRRMADACCELMHVDADGRGGSVTSLEFNRTREAILYTANTPGGVTNMWDLRYKSRGAHVSSKKRIGYRVIRYLRYCDENLYVLDTNGALYKVSQTGTLHASVHPGTNVTPLSVGTLQFVDDLGLLVYVIDETLTLVDLKAMLICAHRMSGLVDVVSLEYGDFIGYDRNGNLLSFSIEEGSRGR